MLALRAPEAARTNALLISPGGEREAATSGTAPYASKEQRGGHGRGLRACRREITDGDPVLRPDVELQGARHVGDLLHDCTVYAFRGGGSPVRLIPPKSFGRV